MFINSFCSISSAGIFDSRSDCNGLTILPQGKADCIEPAYTDLIPAMQLRRMSKPVRTGVAAAKLCMKGFDDFHPASIHIGTAYGMLQDSETFLNKMLEQKELLLNPTAFIQSTHNTVSGQIALSIGCNAHNMTYVHNAHSFENALLDASLILDGPGTNDTVLVGAVEETTETSYKILRRFGVYNDRDIAAGEGATFFALSGQRRVESVAEIRWLEMFVCREDGGLDGKIETLLNQAGPEPKDKDLLVHNIDQDAIPDVFNKLDAVNYLSLGGKYATMAAFGLSLSILKLKELNRERCWVLNKFGKYCSLMLIVSMA